MHNKKEKKGKVSVKIHDTQDDPHAPTVADLLSYEVQAKFLCYAMRKPP